MKNSAKQHLMQDTALSCYTKILFENDCHFIETPEMYHL